MGKKPLLIEHSGLPRHQHGGGGGGNYNRSGCDPTPSYLSKLAGGGVSGRSGGGVLAAQPGGGGPEGV